MITDEQCIPGTTVVVNKKVTQWNDSIGAKHNGLVCQEEKDLGSMLSKSFELIPDTIIEITSKLKRCKFASSAKYVTFKVKNVNGIDSNTKFSSFWISFKHKVDLSNSISEDVDVNKPEIISKRYKIFFKGKPYKPKYFEDMGKIKSSLLIAFGYYNNQYVMFEKYKDRNPELQDNQIPEWFSYGNSFKRSDCKDIEIMTYVNGSKTPVKENFDVLEYYDQSMKLIDVTAQFGSAARELFKNTMQTKEFSYMLVYSPDEYRDPKIFNSYGYVNFDFSALKESQKIKDVVKKSGLKDIKKSTKFGKTAIVFKNLDDLKQIMLRLDPKEYFILDCDGDQLVEKNTRFIKLIMIQKAAEENEQN